MPSKNIFCTTYKDMEFLGRFAKKCVWITFRVTFFTCYSIVMLTLLPRPWKILKRVDSCTSVLPLRGGEMLDASTGSIVGGAASGCPLQVNRNGAFSVHLRRGKVLWLKVCVFDAAELMMMQSRKRKNTMVEGRCL